MKSYSPPNGDMYEQLHNGNIRHSLVVMESTVEIDGWGSVLVTSDVRHESNGCSTMTAADVADVGCGVVYELVLLMSRFSWSATMQLFWNSETPAKQGRAMKTSLVRPSPKLFGRCAPSEVWLQNVLNRFIGRHSVTYRKEHCYWDTEKHILITQYLLAVTVQSWPPPYAPVMYPVRKSVGSLPAEAEE